MSGHVAVLAGAALVAAAGVLAVVRLRRRYLLVTVLGESMLPTYRPGERVLVRRTPPDALRVGQVVVLRGHGAPDEGPGGSGAPGANARGAAAGREAAGQAAAGRASLSRRWTIKRVAATPGDPIPRDTVPALRSAPGTQVPAGRLVVLGDNPERSHDSRHAGYLSADRLFGVVLRKVGS